MRVAVLFFGLFGMAVASFGAEPYFCDPVQFKKLEIKYKGKSPQRLHVYKIGNLTLAGMAVGNSKVEDVVGLADTYGNVAASEKYCTWYFNDGNSQAQKSFNWRYVPRPIGSDYKKTGDTYMNMLGDEFDQSAVSFVSCAVNTGYVGMGCDGMKHRGPSVFAMFLTYAGCTPEHAATIATQVWGTNGILVEMRTQLGKRSAAVAAAHPELAKQLVSVMSQ